MLVKLLFNSKRNDVPEYLQDEAVAQLKDKYLKTEMVDEGYVIVFDPETQAGELCVPKRTEISKCRQIISFNIGIGK